MTDVWIVQNLGDGWRAAYRVVIQEGSTVVGELRIYPKDGETVPGEWTAEQEGVTAQAPTGGLRASTIRRARIGADFLTGRFELAGLMSDKASATIADTLRQEGLVHPSPFRAAVRSRRGPGRPSRPDRDYRDIIRSYLKAQNRQSQHPARDAAERCGVSESRVRYAILTARRRLGWLQPARGRGRTGIALTDEGRRALKLR